MNRPRLFAPEFLASLAAIHADVDRRAAELSFHHADLLVCTKGCSDCCQDDLTVLEIEAAWILAHRDQWLGGESAPHPRGKCAFLTVDGACRVYPWRPYVCRTQGLPLRWLDDEGCEGRSICPLNETEIAKAGLTLGALASESFWLLGTIEGRLASLQAEASGEFSQVRISLRDLLG